MKNLMKKVVAVLFVAAVLAGTITIQGGIGGPLPTGGMFLVK